MTLNKVPYTDAELHDALGWFLDLRNSPDATVEETAIALLKLLRAGRPYSEAMVIAWKLLAHKSA